MDVTEAEIARIPRRNLRVPVASFAAVWVAAERRCGEANRCGGHDWYSLGVVLTCRWLAHVTVRLPAPLIRPRRWGLSS
ncbi:MAG: hypothetical protein ACRDQJ_13100 [Pseudonocardiaceae bacterium]